MLEPAALWGMWCQVAPPEVTGIRWSTAWDRGPKPFAQVGQKSKQTARRSSSSAVFWLEMKNRIYHWRNDLIFPEDGQVKYQMDDIVITTLVFVQQEWSTAGNTARQLEKRRRCLLSILPPKTWTRRRRDFRSLIVEILHIPSIICRLIVDSRNGQSIFSYGN